MNILMVLTSHDKLGDTGKKTGFWLEEFAAPYYVFKDAGAKITLASPKGGQPPLDPKSDEPDAQTEATKRFKSDPDAQKVLANTVPLKDISDEDYDAVFYPGGHGPMWDLATDEHSIQLIENMYAQGKVVAAVCHAPAALLNATAPDEGPLVRHRRVTGFTNSEEEAVQLTSIVPFLLEDALLENDARYSKGPDWKPYVVTEGSLVTGQNPASSEPAAEEVLRLLGARREAAAT